MRVDHLESVRGTEAGPPPPYLTQRFDWKRPRLLVFAWSIKTSTVSLLHHGTIWIWLLLVWFGCRRDEAVLVCDVPAAYLGPDEDKCSVQELSMSSSV